MILEINQILKRNPSDEENRRYNSREFKIVPNMIVLWMWFPLLIQRM